jgi:putative phosphoribosyl transferase
MLFRNRQDAGRQLAAALSYLKGQDCVVLALPRGGVPVAVEVARALDAPLDLLLVRKIGAPHHPELAVGAVVDGGKPIVVRDEELIRLTGTSRSAFEQTCQEELAEIERRRKFYLAGRPPASVAGKVAIVVDDGLATGNTMRVALEVLRQRHPRRTVMAVPVAPASTLKSFRKDADEIICLQTPEPFGAVGYFYDDFTPTSDAEVIAILRERAPSMAAKS